MADVEHPKDGLPVLPFPSPVEWERWLAENCAGSRGLWLQIGKKGSGVPTVTYAEALDVALCYGWIDGQKGAWDETWFVQRFTPRGPRSKWSKINRDKVLQLLADGRMRPSGLAQVEQAQADGRWEQAYDGQRTASVPADLQAALDREPAACEFFERLDRANRYAMLYRVEDAKRPETRARRIEQFVSMLACGEKLHP